MTQYEISKVDTERRLVFGWANVAIQADGTQVTDSQDDQIDEYELENAAYEFNLNSRTGGEMHQRTGIANLVESFVVTKEKLAALSLPEDALPVGWWVGFKVIDDAVWQAVKSGKYKMFSIGGRAKRVEVS